MAPLTLKELIEVVHGRLIEPAAHATLTGTTTDSRQVRPGDLFFAIRGPRFDGHDFVAEAFNAGAGAAVVSDTRDRSALLSQRRPIVLVRDTLEALAKLARFNRRRLTATVVAVTGSNGKTTTKDMIHHVLADAFNGRAAPKSFNNEIGLPRGLLAGTPCDEYLVVEIGSNAPGEVARLADIAEPDIAVITSVSETHLEGLQDLDGVATEKLALLDHLRDGGFAAVNIDSPAVQRLLGRKTPETTLTFGLSDQADLRACDVRPTSRDVTFKLNAQLEIRLTVPGRHNAVNAVAAIAVARRMGMDDEQIARRLATFQLQEMRLQRTRAGGIEIINDAYNANPASMLAAIEVLQTTATRGRRVMVAGDMRELGRAATQLHLRLGEAIAEAGVDVLVAVGEYADEIIAGAKDADARLTTYRFPDVASAAAELTQILRRGDLVLIKGSRALGMERLVEEVAIRCSKTCSG